MITPEIWKKYKETGELTHGLTFDSEEEKMKYCYEHYGFSMKKIEEGLLDGSLSLDGLKELYSEGMIPSKKLEDMFDMWLEMSIFGSGIPHECEPILMWLFDTFDPED